MSVAVFECQCLGLNTSACVWKTSVCCWQDWPLGHGAWEDCAADGQLHFCGQVQLHHTGSAGVPTHHAACHWGHLRWRLQVPAQLLYVVSTCFVYTFLMLWNYDWRLAFIDLFVAPGPSWWPELQLQSRSTRPESCHRTPDWGKLQPAEYCLAVWLPVCSSVSTNGPTDLRTQQLHNSLCTLWHNNRVMLQWVPAPGGIAGNETADRLAKAAAKLPQPHLSTSYKEVKTLLKQKQKSAWRLKNNGYDPQKDQINTLDRRTQATIFHLRTSHCGLRNHLKRLGLADSAHSECGSEEQTPEHILQTCPNLETVRQQFWPEDTEVGAKLWGQATELQRTADFLAATGARI